jgi:DNA-binding GntR family transcriptional regulator
MTDTNTPSLTDRAYKAIEERIVTLELSPGQLLSEHSLADQLGIGRTPIREALQRLAREGLVVILPRRGILVSEINLLTHLDLIEVRREIERLMARAAAERADTAERKEFAVIAKGMKEAAKKNQDIAFMRLDRDLNQAIAGAARNEYARKTMGLMAGLSRRFWYSHYKDVADLPLCARLHADLARAIARADAEAAAAASDKLIDYIEKFARATVGTRRR